MKFIDLRSDTVTRPSRAMREVMANAVVGDDGFGDDPGVNALQQKVAEMLGHEASLFFPSATQANLCAIMAHCQRGEEYLVGNMAHAYRWEGGGAAVLGSVQPQPIIQGDDGQLPLAALDAAVKPDDIHHPRTKLLALENTWFGHVLPQSYIESACAWATGRGLLRHLDGARLFNAAVSQANANQSTPEVEIKRIARHFDSVSICFSKGLGAPAGAALSGSASFIARTRRLRQMCGGGMRQTGILASAAAFALDTNVQRLQDDHRRAARLADALRTIGQLDVQQQTNMLLLTVRDNADSGASLPSLIEFLQSNGVGVTGLYSLRLVTHMDIADDDIDQTIALFKRYFSTFA
ncbi:MAG: low-specificity L-threonine aldolase [Pandoraea sp.]|nr:low-specificity L-threonine aldolase [Pandoraea sp.]MDR3398855.1 low-specificity L-threonine aldolase [Pandoraea sp.]